HGNTSALSDSQLPQDSRETKSMHKPKNKREQPAPFHISTAKNIFHTNVNNRGRDDRFHNLAGDVHNIEGRQRECERMCECETGDNLRNRNKTFANDEQRKEKQQMIVADQNVFNAENEEF